MPQPRQRTSRARVQGVGAAQRNYRGVRSDPIFQAVLANGLEDNPGAWKALYLIEEMRHWGVDVTPEIALRCLASRVIQESEQDKYRAESEARALAKKHPPIVYYMRLGSLVKIGFTENLTSRLDTINPEELMTTEPGGRERERERHHEFDALRAHGEWFRLEGPLVDHIAAVRREAAGES